MFTKAGVIAQTHKVAGYTVSDADAIAFLSATGITDNTISQAIDTLVIAAKANGWWTLCIAIYPFVGGTATTHKYNLKDPQDTDGAFRLSFTGSWTHSANGALPSFSYADTHIVPSTSLNLNDVHGSYYSRSDTINGYDFGSFGTNSNQEFGMLIKRPAGAFYSFIYDESSSIIAGTLSDGSGYFISSRTNSTSHNLYRNGASIASNTGSNGGTRPPYSVYLAALNFQDSAGDYGTKECAFSTFGTGISGALASTMYTDIQAFQTSLSRQV